MSSKVFVISTRPPTAPLSGGMAPAVRDACNFFDETIWLALVDKTDLKYVQTMAAHNISPDIDGDGLSHQMNPIEGIDIRVIPIDPAKWAAHYETTSNRETWPLCHDLTSKAQQLSVLEYFGTSHVNHMMAKDVCAQLKGDTTTPIWIHDYHHLSLAFFLRQEEVTNPIIYFHHTPLPSLETLNSLKEESRVAFIANLKGLLYTDQANFQTAETAKRFMQIMGQPASQLALYQTTKINIDDREVIIGNFPISINPAEVSAKAQEPVATKSAKALVNDMIADTVFINFERFDYSKGILPRLLAFEKFMEYLEKNHPEQVGNVQIVIGAEPSRADIPEYAKYVEDGKAIINRINAKMEWYCTKDGVQKPPIVLMHKSIEQNDVYRLMRSTEDQLKIGLVTPYRDGMNLVSKQFPMSQNPEFPGVLVLSNGAGAAQELSNGNLGAVGYDPDENRGTTDPDDHYEPILQAMITAFKMDLEERKKRNAYMVAAIKANPISRWAEEHRLAMTPQDTLKFQSTPAFGDIGQVPARHLVNE